MIDDDVKQVEKMRDSLFKSLKNPDGTWKTPKHSTASKELCDDIKNDINEHCSFCSVCKVSMEEYKKFGFANTPPCKDFEKYMRGHIAICPICNSAQNKWNDDAIPVTPLMRSAVVTLFKLKEQCGL